MSANDRTTYTVMSELLPEVRECFEFARVPFEIGRFDPLRAVYEFQSWPPGMSDPFVVPDSAVHTRPGKYQIQLCRFGCLIHDLTTT